MGGLRFAAPSTSPLLPRLVGESFRSKLGHGARRRRLGRGWVKISFGGLVQVLLIRSVPVTPSAMQALGDWRKSLNWGTFARGSPIVTIRSIARLERTRRRKPRRLVGESVQTGGAHAFAAYRRACGVSSGRLPPLSSRSSDRRMRPWPSKAIARRGTSTR